ncbi:HAD hydrolase-like protein [Oenococcus sp. UCMA 16435]|nr:HAD hydrolase-like protein [Oenococcus sp. UCMA 16435]
MELKTDPGNFSFALKTAHAKAENSVYVGDRVDDDIAPTKKISFITVRIKQGFGKFQEEKKNCPSDFVIDNISQMKDLF